MSNHVRKQIRNAAKEALQNLGTTGDRVFVSRGYGVTKEQLPCILIYTPSEGSERDQSPTESMRDVELKVYGMARIKTDVEDELDDMAFEVEQALDTLGDIDGLCKIYHGIQETNSTIVAEETDVPHGAIEMEFLYTYRTRAGTPDIAR